MSILMRRLLASVIVLFCVVCSAARADQILRRLSPHSFATDSWKFVSAYSIDTNLVSAIVAIAKPGTTIGDNLHTVLFLRTGTGWDAYSWRTATPEDALYTCKLILNIPDSDNDLFGRPDLVALFDPLGARPPLPYLAGMLTDDPLFNVVVNSETPEALIDMLVSMGYSAAALRPGDGGGEIGGCPGETLMLTSMAETVDWAGAGIYATDANAEQLATGMALNLRACIGPEPEPDCTPEQITPWAETLVPGQCGFVYVGIRPEPRIDNNWRWSCMYELRKPFTEYRSAKFRKADCSEVTCTQKRTGYTPGVTIFCLVVKPDPTPAPSCPNIPSCGLNNPDDAKPACESKYAAIWGLWKNEPDVPCP